MNPRGPTNLSAPYKSEGIPPRDLYVAYSVIYHLMILSIKGDSSDRELLLATHYILSLPTLKCATIMEIKDSSDAKRICVSRAYCIIGFAHN